MHENIENDVVRTRRDDVNARAFSRGGRWMRRALFVLLWVLLSVLTLWASAALYFDFSVPRLRIPSALVYFVAIVLGVIFGRGRLFKVALCLVGFFLVLGWWLSLTASNNRDWQPDVAVLPYAEMENGHLISLHNIRNCDYQTETNYVVRHYDKKLDLDDLITADLFLIYWGSPNIAHTMLSFGFKGGEYICISIETRKEAGESYSALRGFFRQYELTYVIADERDLVRLRTNYRQGEEVYLYRLQAPPEQARALFLQYINRANELKQRAVWYNALTSNCTTNIRYHNVAVEGRRPPFDWRIIVNGHIDEMLFERGKLPDGLSFSNLKQLCYINPAARQADKSADFSRLIRDGVPGIRVTSGAATNSSPSAD